MEGSPPPMRGKGFKFPFVGICSGITPAYAGKSPQSLYDAAQERDHPRLCGEKRQKLQLGTAPTGSPPPMRGKAQGVMIDEPRTRITPAYAGKSGKK